MPVDDPNDAPLILPGDSRPTRADAVKNREKLLATAAQLFERDGVDSVSMTQIAQAAGVGKGTLYRHFADKNAVCQALLDAEQRALQERTLRLSSSGQDACATLRWFVEAVARFVDRNDDLLYAGAEAGSVSLIAYPAHLWWRQTIRGLLLRIGIPGDVDYLADMLYVMLDVNTIRFQRRALRYDIERIIDGLNAALDRFMATCRPSP